MRRPTRDRGQAAVVVVIVTAVLFVAVTTGIAAFGVRALDRTRAQTTADACALAALDGGQRAAQDLAQRHGASLVSFLQGPPPHSVTVVVRVGSATATAAASREP